MKTHLSDLVLVGLLAVAWLGAEPAGGADFTENLLQNGFGYAYGLAAGDLDGDGQPEITVGDADNGQLSGFVNQGNQTFQQFSIGQEAGSLLERHEIGDVNDAERISTDPAMRHVVGGRAALPDKRADPPVRWAVLRRR